MSTDNSLSRHVHSFFQDYLIRRRDLSPHTVLSYRDTLKLFLRFASRHLRKSVVDLSVDLLDVDLVLYPLHDVRREPLVDPHHPSHRNACRPSCPRSRIQRTQGAP